MLIQWLLLLLLSRLSRVRRCAAPQTAAHQAPPSPGFSRQEPWSGLLFPSPGHACMLSHFSRVQLCATPRTAAHQAPPSTGFSRQEYWSGLPFPSPNTKTSIGFLRPEALYHLNTEGRTHPSPPGPLTGAWGLSWRPTPTLHWQPFSKATIQTEPYPFPFTPCWGTQDPSVPWHRVQAHFQTQSLRPKSILSWGDHVRTALHSPIVPSAHTALGWGGSRCRGERQVGSQGVGEISGWGRLTHGLFLSCSWENSQASPHATC